MGANVQSLLMDYGASAVNTPYGSSVTWNPSDKSANITLSGSNLVSTLANGTEGMVRATAQAPAGVCVFEVTAGANSNTAITAGVGTVAAPVGGFPGDGTTSYGYSFQTGNLLYNAGNAQTGGVALSNGQVLGIIIDIPNNKLYFFVQGVLQYTQSHSLGSTLYAMTGGQSIGGGAAAVTGNFGATSFAYTYME
jgi:hypothetical protein